MTEGGGAEEAARRLRELARLLRRFADIMAEQAEFHVGTQMDFSLTSVRHAATHAERRLKHLDIAGARWLLEMERTMLGELIRATSGAAAVLVEAGSDAWPDLSAAADETRNTLRAAASRDPRLFAPEGFDGAALDDAVDAPFGMLRGWRETQARSYAALAADGVLLSVVAWNTNSDGHWLAQVGGISFGLHGSAETAACHAEAIHLAIFAPPVGATEDRAANSAHVPTTCFQPIPGGSAAA